MREPHHLGHHNGEMAITGHGDGTFISPARTAAPVSPRYPA